MPSMFMVNLEVIKSAAYYLIKASLLDELEDVDAHAKLPRNCKDDRDKFIRMILKKEWTAVLAAMSYLIGAIDRQWSKDQGSGDIQRHSLGLLLYHSHENNVEAQSDLLYHLLMGCFGHGINIEDSDYKIEDAVKKLWGDKEFDPSPIYTEDQCIRELFSQYLTYTEQPA